MKIDFTKPKTFLFILLFAILIWILFHLQYDLFRFKDVLNPILYCVAIVFFIRLIAAYSKVMAALIGVVLFFVSAILSVGLLMCANLQQGIGYISRNNDNLRLREWSYDCGAVDSNPDYTYTKERRITDHLAWIVELNETKVDTTEWKKL